MQFFVVDLRLEGELQQGPCYNILDVIEFVSAQQDLWSLCLFTSGSSRDEVKGIDSES